MRGRPVLVGVDASDASREAVELGGRIAIAAGGSLHLVTAALDVISEVTATRLRMDPAPLRAGLAAEAAAKVRAKLEGALPQDLLERSLQARIGRPERVLADAARELGVGLVVLGGKSHHGVSSWFRRGTAHHLLRELDTPLLVVGPRSSRVARVLVAVDLSFAAAITIPVAEELAGVLDVPLEGLHVIDDSVLTSGARLPFDSGDLVRDTEQRLAAEVWPLLHPRRARSTRVGPLDETLVSAALEEPPAIVAVGSHGFGWTQRWLLGSTTEELLSRLPASLLVVPCAPPPGGRA
jgi:nucleotide-binding universal stress UspA family protein